MSGHHVFIANKENAHQHDIIHAQSCVLPRCGRKYKYPRIFSWYNLSPQVWDHDRSFRSNVRKLRRLSPYFPSNVPPPQEFKDRIEYTEHELEMRQKRMDNSKKMRGLYYRRTKAANKEKDKIKLDVSEYRE